jgi:predicted metal-dependent hydrolase
VIDWLRAPVDPRISLAEADLPIAIRRHPTARRMTLRLAPDGAEVRITVPRWGRTAEALAFAESRRDWLEAQLAKCARPNPPAPGGVLAYRGGELAIEWAAGSPRRPELSGAQVRLGGPEHSVAARLRRWLEGEALRLMGEDLAEYCAAAARPVPALALSRAHRRWGSCSGSGAIRLNWRLVQAPDAVRRSVVAHEVAHLVHFDHSPAFHALLGRLYEGDLPAANRWLRHHGRTLYSAFG